MGSSRSGEWFTGAAREGLLLFWSACAGEFRAGTAEIRRQLQQHAPDPERTSLSAEQAAARDEQLFMAMQRGVDTGDFRTLVQALTAIATSWSHAGLGIDRWFETSHVFRLRMLNVLFQHYAANPAQLREALLAMQLMQDHVGCVISDQYIQERERMLGLQTRQTEAALLRYKRLFESGIVGIFIGDLQGHIKEANDGFLAMIGYRREDVGTLSWQELTPQEWVAIDNEVVEQLKVFGRTQPWEKEYRRKDGTRVPVVIGVAMLDESECVCIVLDASERKRLEELRQRSRALIAKNTHIAEAHRQKSEFLTNMSHEMRSPLTSIIGFAELLASHDALTHAQAAQGFAHNITDSARHLLSIVNDVLDLAKVESGTMKFRPESTAIDRLVGEVCTAMSAVAQQRDVHIESTVEPDVARATLDPGRLKQVLFNYVSNGLKFSEPGSQLRVRVRREGATALRLEVADTGHGIAEPDLARLFHEFVQLDTGLDTSQPSTGLGLALTKRIVESQGGRVGVESVVGKGSTFFAVVPLGLPSRPPLA